MDTQTASPYSKQGAPETATALSLLLARPGYAARSLDCGDAIVVKLIYSEGSQFLEASSSRIMAGIRASELNREAGLPSYGVWATLVTEGHVLKGMGSNLDQALRSALNAIESLPGDLAGLSYEEAIELCKSLPSSDYV